MSPGSGSLIIAGVSGTTTTAASAGSRGARFRPSLRSVVGTERSTTDSGQLGGATAEDTFMAEFSAMMELFWLQFTQILQQQREAMSNDVPY
jgi:hypothetical protein